MCGRKVLCLSPHQAQKPDDGDQYIVCKSSDFDLILGTRALEIAEREGF